MQLSCTDEVELMQQLALCTAFQRSLKGRLQQLSMTVLSMTTLDVSFVANEISDMLRKLRSSLLVQAPNMNQPATIPEAKPITGSAADAGVDRGENLMTNDSAQGFRTGGPRNTEKL